MLIKKNIFDQFMKIISLTKINLDMLIKYKNRKNV